MAISHLAGWLVLALASAPPPAGPAEEFERTCDRAGIGLWGRPLCAPIVIVAPGAGTHRASRREPGPLPPLRANTAFDWAGEKWVMVLEPLPLDPAAARALLFHEAWHAHQEALGFPSNMAVAAHLDDPAARYLLRLEWEALGRALRARGAASRSHAGQALAFRARRLAAHSGAAEAERAQMRHEGLAAYTGAALSGDPLRLALAELEAAPRQQALGRSFAYASGPAWGLLLDRLRPDWRQRIRAGGDLPDLVPLRPAAVARPDDYGGGAILAKEHLAGMERQARIAALTAATAQARSLRLPLARMNMDFDPNRIVAGPDGSSIYERITLGDEWGRVRVDGTPLRIAADFSAAFLPWPAPEGALELAEGWRVEARPGGGGELVRPRD